jgi:thymidylate kinase
MIITIEGKRGEGKTTIADKILNGIKYSYIHENSLKSPFWSSFIEQDSEFLVIDEVVNYEKVYNMFNVDSLNINRKGKPRLQIKTPNIILIKQSRRS